MVATHYYNPDDERQIKGANDMDKPELIYEGEVSPDGKAMRQQEEPDTF